MEKSNAITVTVVGGGNSAHILIPFLSTAGHKVNLLTRRPNDWDDTITCEETDMNNNVTKTFRGNLAKKSENPEDVIPDADAIILCMPVHTQREVLSRIGPHIDQSKPVSFHLWANQTKAFTLFHFL
jgi:glycerol-3-phosphate dehydrogenase